MRTATAAGLVLLMSTVAQAGVHTVDCGGGGSFMTIQDAVEAAVSGDTILVAPCVYEERVDVVDKVLHIRGSGPDMTEISWTGDQETVHISTAPAEYEFVGEVSGFTIRREPAGLPALFWDRGLLSILDCAVPGGELRAGWDDPPPAIDLRDSDIHSVWIHGSGRYSGIINSSVGTVSLSGYQLYSGVYWHHYLTSEGSEYGTLELGLTAADLSGDVVDVLDMGQLASCRAVDTWFGEVESECSSLHLTDCEVQGGVSVWGGTDLNQHTCGTLEAEGCLFGGDVEVYVDLYEYEPGTASVEASHNTFLGDLMLRYAGGGEGLVCPLSVRGNLVSGATHIIGNAVFDVCTVISHNDFVDGAALPPYCDSLYANISADPLFCSEGDYTLQECSPCVGTAHDGGDIGAFGIGCPCWTSIEERSWGSVKSLYQ
jgi:hypothetical protein